MLLRCMMVPRHICLETYIIPITYVNLKTDHNF